MAVTYGRTILGINMKALIRVKTSHNNCVLRHVPSSLRDAVYFVHYDSFSSSYNLWFDFCVVQVVPPDEIYPQTVRFRLLLSLTMYYDHYLPLRPSKLHQ